ncbi:MAG: DUF2088 domain-containing protein [Chloroflexi bacterium]|uniref:DUF2088 domain-containing protein n=1 Tax=Candidatus Chlorohelix allophototropha TaxID=3003348 RepID=A0A8T7M100_9CHLR|nr:DUF2088 domain-containing protein [Chloroflexota bacterium]WJW66143.1 lactate racemase domain-containing protein [Chloroflexota bacterium L227-S17]
MRPVTIKLAYGKTGLPEALPEENLAIVEPQFIPGLADERVVLIDSLHSPIHSNSLSEIVALVFCDSTRPMPNNRVLPMGHTSFGAEAWVCTEYLKADVNVLTGILEGATVEII